MNPACMIRTCAFFLHAVHAAICIRDDAAAIMRVWIIRCVSLAQVVVVDGKKKNLDEDSQNAIQAKQG